MERCSPDTVARQRLSDLLTCPVCLDLYDQPRTLPKCKHDFCKACVRRVLSANRSLLKCPLCRTDNTAAIPGGSVNELPRNAYLDSVIQFLRHQCSLEDLDHADVESLVKLLDKNRADPQEETERRQRNLTRDSSRGQNRGRPSTPVSHSAASGAEILHETSCHYCCPKCENGFDSVAALNIHVSNCNEMNTYYCADDQIDVWVPR